MPDDREMTAHILYEQMHLMVARLERAKIPDEFLDVVGLLGIAVAELYEMFDSPEQAMALVAWATTILHPYHELMQLSDNETRH